MPSAQQVSCGVFMVSSLHITAQIVAVLNNIE